MTPTEITITNEQGRRMATVAAAATEDALRNALTTDQRNAIHAVGLRLVTDGDANGFASLFGAGDPAAELADLQLEDEILRAYLGALDAIASATATPHYRQACTAVFTALVDAVDADAKGLHFQQYQTLEPTTDERVFG